jgi:aspartate aminotransferase-like enzyme
MPTDALRVFRDTMVETKEYGFDRLKEAQWRLGESVRAMMAAKGIKPVAAEGFGAPGVVVSYTDNPDVKSGKVFAAEGMQIAAGVPLQVGEPDGFSTFRLGLFGLDKLYDVDGTLERLKAVVDKVLYRFSERKTVGRALLRVRPERAFFPLWMSAVRTKRHFAADEQMAAFRREPHG